eukprot:155227-Pleurochrysis_carterae.AAC.1
MACVSYIRLLTEILLALKTEFGPSNPKLFQHPPPKFVCVSLALSACACACGCARLQPRLEPLHVRD